MPRIGRFLYGRWPKNNFFEDLNEGKESSSVAFGYTDYRSNSHRRCLEVKKGKFVILDHVKGFKEKAVLRWRLDPEKDWFIDNNTISNGKISIKISSSSPIKRLEIINGEESRFYLKKDNLSIVECEISEASELKTEISW